MSEFDIAIKLQKKIDHALEYKVSTENLLKEQTVQLNDYIDKCSKEVKDDLKKLNDLGYEYMEHNMTSSIRKIRSDDES